MIRTAYNKGFADALARFRVDKTANFNRTPVTTTPNPASTQSQIPTQMPAARPQAATMPTAPMATKAPSSNILG